MHNLIILTCIYVYIPNDSIDLSIINLYLGCECDNYQSLSILIITYNIIQMQLTVAEDLLRNMENWAVVVGEVIDAVHNDSISNMTIYPPQGNIGTQ